MFTPRVALETGVGPLPAGFGLKGTGVSAARAPQPPEPAARPTERIRRLWSGRADWEARLAAFDWTPDLAEDIGSPRWLRGLATLFGLSALALSCLPDFAALPGAPAASIDGAARDEFRSRTIRPLAYGADSGHHMGATAAVQPVANVPERAMVRLTAIFGAGDDLARMLERAGVGPADAARARSLIAGVVDPATLATGTPVDVTLGKRSAPGAPRPLEALALRARFDLRLQVVRDGGALALRHQAVPVSTMPLRIRGTMGAGIYRSARAAGAPIEAIQQYLQVLDRHLSLDTALERGDTFDLVVGFKRAATGETQVGDLLFAGIESGGKPKAQLLRWGGDGQFFEASGVGAQRSGLLMPVVGRITSNFGARRHPILGYTRMHGGVDFGAPHGSPIYAVGDAAVSYAGWRGGHGNYVRLEHGGGFGTGYAHMSRIAVSPGSRVRAGQVIGYVGSTGLSTGPHLHYELYKGGGKVDPLSVRFTVSNQVDAKELAAFKARMAQLKAVVPGAALAP